METLINFLVLALFIVIISYFCMLPNLRREAFLKMIQKRNDWQACTQPTSASKLAQPTSASKLAQSIKKDARIISLTRDTNIIKLHPDSVRARMKLRYKRELRLASK